MPIRGLLHLHSHYSYDGQETLSQIKHELVSSGISFACMTEHVDTLNASQAEKFIRECQELSEKNFVFIPGFEVPYLGTHIIIIGAHTFKYNPDTIPQSIQEWVEAGAFAIIAHPHRNGFKIDNFMLENTIGSEIWNSQYDGKVAPRPRALSWFHSLKKKKDSYRAFGSVDMHRFDHLGGPQLIVEAPYPLEEFIVSSLRNGSYHIQRKDVRLSSSGILMDGSPLLLSLRGWLSVGWITAGKKINRVLKFFGLASFPFFRSLRKAIRRVI